LFSGNEVVFIFSCILTGSCLAFLIYNSFPAKIYLGDGGSYLLGFMISILSLFSLNNQLVNPVSLVLLVSLPVLDMSRVIFLRLFNKNSPFLPDRKHLHHIIVDSGIDHKNTVLMLYGITLFFVVLAVIVGLSTLN
jgi:UDP-GlcNAc:undecaprenyl-phosphate GlcNAc-1-phosphate transferase